ncbi:cytochrome P450 [Desarmillaria tabescens]|uniref:Cytochrome P450 n=1 Tax=Armillaria tabescens TaxID=1929756 RepID=A0AA39JUV1_ARMTA|nr:cytochrome P450 [Desarmillaria tabescens]KAK0447013.1 cytochrome P450 [Desarmillaria tabescens]
MLSLGIGLALVISLAVIAWLSKPKHLPLPPGPKPLPILGNLRDFRLKELWISTTARSQKYGDVCYLHVLGWSVIFLSSPDSAYELLDKRGAIYSDKPQLETMGELSLPLSNDGEKFKRQRRHMQHTLGPRSIPLPSEYLGHIRKYAGSLTLSVIYTLRATSSEDKFLVIAEECLSILANELTAGSGIWPVDLFPPLKYLPSWMPGAGFKRKAAIWKTKMKNFADQPFESAKLSTREGTILSSFCSKFLADETLSNEEDEFKLSANSMFAASADTTVTSISQFILAMVMYPDILKRAQEEIDPVIGRDRQSLPYVDAVMSEVWRWGVPVPLNLPHCVRQDDVYRGMFIPKGSIVNLDYYRAILRDKTLFPKADVFDPDRFGPDVESELREKRDPRNYIFGFGRRRCPGADLVESSIWILIATMIATLDIKNQ